MPRVILLQAAQTRILPIRTAATAAGMLPGTMKENGFPTREYSLRRPFQDPATDPVVKRQVSQERRMIGKKYANFFSLVKYSLLVTLLFTLCWTLLKIPLTQKELLHREIPEEMLKEIDRMTLISRMATIFLCCFGILGVLMQSFSLTLVFTVFTACRLVAIFLVPGLKTVVVSVALIVTLSLLSLIFLFLVRRTDITSEAEKDNA